MTAVVFDASTFRALYPAIADEVKVPDAALEDCFDSAVEIVGNDSSSLVPYDPDSTPPVKTRLQVLYALTCHLATMRYLWEPTQAGALVSATQGSVSAGLAIDTSSDAWWNRTQCGAVAWMLLKRYASGAIYYGAEYIHRGG